MSQDQTRLIGTWELKCYELRGGPEGTIAPFGDKPLGVISYDKAGNMACQLANPASPLLPAGDEDSIGWRTKISAAIYSAYYGRWEMDEGASLVHHHVTSSLMPDWDGTTVTRSYVFDGDDKLTLSAGIGNGMEAVLEWARIG